VAAVVGRGAFYHVTIGAVVAVLALSANTSFADFPRLCRILAADGYLPEPFEHSGRRLTFSVGVTVLALLAAALLVIFRGVTAGLIPLFAVGAFLAFTMSQAGMVVHWRRKGGRGSRRALAVNAVGAGATASTLAIVFASKLLEGAWISAVLVGLSLAALAGFRRRRMRLEGLTRSYATLSLDRAPPIVVVPLRDWDRVARAALRFAYCLSDEVYALHVRTGDRPEGDLTAVWHRLAEEPLEAAGRKPPHLAVFRSRYRQLYRPILGFVTHVARAHPDRQIAVVVPERVGPHRFLGNPTATLLKWLLLRHGGEGIAIVSAPWYLDDHARRG
jgi:hypothetical protein